MTEEVEAKSVLKVDVECFWYFALAAVMTM